MSVDVNSVKVSYENSKENEDFIAPIDISDIISICKEFNKLGANMQNQIDNMLELGVEDSVKNGTIKVQSLPHIKQFLNQIRQNVYLGDASDQAEELMAMIELFEYNNPHYFVSKKN